MSPYVELREVPEGDEPPRGVRKPPPGCTWLAWTNGDLDTGRWGRDPLEAIERAGEARELAERLSRPGEGDTRAPLRDPYSVG